VELPGEEVNLLRQDGVVYASRGASHTYFTLISQHFAWGQLSKDQQGADFPTLDLPINYICFPSYQNLVKT
jgi:hypothetical protein